MAPAIKGRGGAIQRRGRWGQLECTIIVGGTCMLLLGALWMLSRDDSFGAIWRLWGKSEEEMYWEKPPLSESGTWEDSLTSLTIVSNAVAEGAVCLDGSPPSYYLDRGSGEGADHWIVFLEGGGWCGSHEECLDRSFTILGSSAHSPRQMHLGGILSSSRLANPDFYNWNRVLLKYCDGGSFNGDVSEPVQVNVSRSRSRSGTDWGRSGGGDGSGIVYYRGQRIWKALMQDLQENGLKTARKALLAGCSAGGLASVLHCDQFSEFVPNTTVVKCLSDAGFFLHIPDVSGVQTIEAFYEQVVLLQNMEQNLPTYCTTQRKGTLCLFPQYLIAGIETPLFILNPAYDTWQFQNVLLPRTADPTGSWNLCRRALLSCSETQLQSVQGFRDSLLEGLVPLLNKEINGVFINSCYLHCQSQDTLWNGLRGPQVHGKSIARVVGDWYFNRNSTNIIDGPFPCNPTCY